MAESLQSIAQGMMQPSKGVLAADASKTTMNKRLAAIGVEQDEESRRRYRQLLFTTPGFEEGISAVILYDGTIRQNHDDGTPFVELLRQKGVIPGIKVDKGLVPLHGFEGENVTQGLDDLDMRLKEYYEMGARFAKWRAVIPVHDGTPGCEAIMANAHYLTRYASMCQANGIVPMVEPEVLITGNHTIEQCQDVMRATMSVLFDELELYKVDLTGTILKTSMVLTGKDVGELDDPSVVAEKTVAVLKETVPEQLAGVVYLSGGQEVLQATENLQAITELGPHPWPMTFSYSRALQQPVLEAWKGDDANIEEAQNMFAHRIKMNVAAREGTYSKDMEG